LRKFSLLAAGVLLAAGTLTACLGGPPPPPPTDPHDVLVVGDSVSFAFGCVLGDTLPGVSTNDWNCPARPGYTTKNMAIGACTTWPGDVLLYNGGTAPAPNCDTVAAGPDNRTWEQAASYYVPKVVVIDTSGWEIVDRWVNGQNGQPPDAQWGAAGCTPQNVPPSCAAYQNAAVQYSSALYNAINVFRGEGAKVVVANSPYMHPDEPQPPISSSPAGLGCSWWEPDQSSPPTSLGPDCTGNATAGSGGQWRSPSPGVTYRSSHVKVDQFNTIISFVKSQYFANDPNVLIFPFRDHFNLPNNGGYTDYVCPPPYDRTVAAQNTVDVRPGSPTLGQLVWQCNVDGNPLDNVNAILARAPDRGHLSPAGAFNVLQPYIEKCVEALIPVSGGDPSACS
jgi:hypothetical protein